jgi:hypothetical protein
LHRLLAYQPLRAYHKQRAFVEAITPPNTRFETGLSATLSIQETSYQDGITLPKGQKPQQQVRAFLTPKGRQDDKEGGTRSFHSSDCDHFVKLLNVANP